MSSQKLTMLELQRASGVPRRTLRRWTKSKLLPRAIGRGPAARYQQEHLLRAKLIRELRAQRCTTAEIRERLSTSARELGAAIVTPAVPPAAPPAQPPEPGYRATCWEVVQLGPGLALMLQPASGPAVRRVAEQLYRQCAPLRAVPLGG